MASEPLMGAIFAFAGNFAPRGYMLCQGQLISIQQNSALFAILGTTYGGNGTTTFALPDLRGRAAVSQGQGPGLGLIQLGEMAGSQNVTLTSANIPPHTHALLASAGAGTVDTPTGNSLAATSDPSTGASMNSYSSSSPNSVLNAASVGPSAGGGNPISIQSPVLGINYIIATEGIFPSRN